MANVRPAPFGCQESCPHPGDIAEKATRLLEDPEECRRFGSQARKDFLAKYTFDRNFVSVVGIYERVIAERRVKHGG